MILQTQILRNDGLLI